MPSSSTICRPIPIRIKIHAGLIVVFAMVQSSYIGLLKRIQKSVLTFREPNVTNVERNKNSNTPLEDWRCNVIPGEYCFTDKNLKCARVIPLILFLLEIYLLNNALSLHYRRRCFVLNLYWIASMFVFFCILILIYQGNYYYIIAANNLIAPIPLLLFYAFFAFALL